MDPVLAYMAARPVFRTDAAAGRDVSSSPFVLDASRADSGTSAAAGTSNGGEPAADQQRMLHLISHVDAECFISLLQILDPKPDDYRARADYKRRYEQLREALELPVPVAEPQPKSPAE
jgi:hypothetical protein